jgi:hypothetical protein
MLKIAIIGLVIAMFIITLFVFGACKAAGDADDRAGLPRG